MYVCKVFCRKAGPSLKEHYQSRTEVLLGKREAVCKSLSSLNQKAPQHQLALRVTAFMKSTETTLSQMQLLSATHIPATPILSQF